MNSPTHLQPTFRRSLQQAALAIVLLMLFAGTDCRGQAKHSSSLLILSKKEHVLAITDPVSLLIKAKIPVGEDPHEVIASADGTKAYVTIYGGGRLHTINAIDLVQQKRLDDIDTRPLFGPHGIVYVDGKVWFSAEGSKAVGRYDPTTKALDWSMGTGQDRTHMIYVTADGKEAYTTNVNAGTVSILEAPAGDQSVHREWIETVVPTSRGSEGFDVAPDGKELWTASSTDGMITIINLDTKKPDARIDAAANGANRLKFTPDGNLVFISSLSQHDAIVYDTHTRKEVRRIDLGSGAAGIEMDPDGTRVFVACTPADNVAVIDMKTLRIVKRISLGGPDGMAWVH